MSYHSMDDPLDGKDNKDAIPSGKLGEVRPSRIRLPGGESPT